MAMQSPIRLLIVDDEEITLRNLEHVMKKESYQVMGTQSGLNALKLLANYEFDVVLTDLKMEKVDGMEILKHCRQNYPDTEVIMITAYATLDSAVKAMKEGAYYYIAKPFKLDEVRKVVKEAGEKVRLKRENRRLKEHLEKFKDEIITQNMFVKRLLNTARQAAQTDCNILITGETGTGKGLLARYIHIHSKRANGPFLAINCGAFSEELIANELFGHEKGAFTGATSVKKGLIEMASEGTLFLDEITEMSPNMQAKLLRVLQEREVLRLGATRAINIDARFIAATNRDIQEAVKKGRFRQDLFYRLNVISFFIPPLSARKEDIPLLTQYFLQKYSTIMNKTVNKISPEALEVLRHYDFPGNVRELENIIERGVALTQTDTLEVKHLPEDLQKMSIKTFRRDGQKIPTLEEQEKAYIEWVLEKTGGNKTLAAQALGIDRVSLWRKLKKYKINHIENET